MRRALTDLETLNQTSKTERLDRVSAADKTLPEVRALLEQKPVLKRYGNVLKRKNWASEIRHTVGLEGEASVEVNAGDRHTKI